MSRASGVHSLRVSAAGAIGLREPAGAWRHAGARLSARSATWAVLTLAAAFLISFALKAANIGVGAPQFMIDDFTLYQGGFLVWFGQAPPQHAFLESWVCGLSSLAVYAVRTALSGDWTAARDGYFVSSALRDFYNAPEAYYAAYRSVLIAVDLATAFVVFRLARRVLDNELWAAVWVTVLFLFTYNTLWSTLVGRPDTLLTFAATLGVYLYLESVEGTSERTFWWAAICLGLAAGLKMHGALFTIFVMIDQLRLKGLRAGWRPAAAFAATAFFFFLVADGSSLFDPLMYVKARWATYHDDYSPYLHWGDQFLVILKGTGWLIAPLAAAGAILAFRRPAPPALKSVAVLALGYLVVFCTTRQLRGYWMLPAAPLFYVLAAWSIGQLRRPRLRVVMATAALVIIIGQMLSLSWRLRQTDLNELRSWVVANVAAHEPFYLLGDSVLRLPRNTGAMSIYRTAYERELANDITAGRPFVERHMKNWEEISTLRLFDMLDYQNDKGYTFFHYRDMPPQKFPDLVRLDRMAYLIVQEQFPVGEVPGLGRLLADDFRLVGERRSEGGDGGGLLHRVYRRVRP
jgi:hypothetical protein